MNGRTCGVCRVNRQLPKRLILLPCRILFHILPNVCLSFTCVDAEFLSEQNTYLFRLIIAFIIYPLIRGNLIVIYLITFLPFNTFTRQLVVSTVPYLSLKHYTFTFLPDRLGLELEYEELQLVWDHLVKSVKEIKIRTRAQRRIFTSILKRYTLILPRPRILSSHTTCNTIINAMYIMQYLQYYWLTVAWQDDARWRIDTLCIWY